MIKQSDIEVFNRVIDGLANADEQEEVRALLDRDSSAREYFDSLVLAATQLAKSERVAPPSDLKANVMSEISALGVPAPVRGRPSFEFFAFLRQQWKQSTSFNLAVGTVAGAAAVLAIVGVFNGAGDLSKDSLSGTIGAGNPGSTTKLASGTVAAGHSSAQFDLIRAGKTLTANILANSADVAQVSVTFDQSDLSFIAVTAQANQISPLFTDSHIQFTATPGTSYKVVFEDRSPVVSTLKIDISDDQLTSRQEISTGSDVSAK